METKIFRCKGENAGQCMSDRLLQRKCKSCRFDACLKAGMRKDNLGKNVKKAKEPTKLDPGQTKAGFGKNFFFNFFINDT